MKQIKYVHCVTNGIIPSVFSLLLSHKISRYLLGAIEIVTMTLTELPILTSAALYTVVSNLRQFDIFKNFSTACNGYSYNTRGTYFNEILVLYPRS